MIAEPSEEAVGFSEETMAKTVADMTPVELRLMVGALIEEKLLELLGDPDEGLELRESVRLRLEKQREAVAAGERGRPLADGARELGLQ